MNRQFYIYLAVISLLIATCFKVEAQEYVLVIAVPTDTGCVNGFYLESHIPDDERHIQLIDPINVDCPASGKYFFSDKIKINEMPAKVRLSIGTTDFFDLLFVSADELVVKSGQASDVMFFPDSSLCSEPEATFSDMPDVPFSLTLLTLPHSRGRGKRPEMNDIEYISLHDYASGSRVPRRGVINAIVALMPLPLEVIQVRPAHHWSTALVSALNLMSIYEASALAKTSSAEERGKKDQGVTTPSSQGEHNKKTKTALSKGGRSGWTKVEKKGSFAGWLIIL